MHHRVFVYGTLLRGEVNHHHLARAELLGACRTEPCFTLFHLGAYPGLGRGGRTAIAGEVYRVDGAGLRYLDRLEDYPRLYDRKLIPTPFGRAWVYLYRGDLGGRPVIQGGDWRAFAADPGSYRAAGIRGTRDPKNHRRPRFSDRRVVDRPQVDANGRGSNGAADPILEAFVLKAVTHQSFEPPGP